MMINRRKVPDEPPGKIPPPPPNPLQVRVEAIRAKTMGCCHCNDDGFCYVWWKGKREDIGGMEFEDRSLKEPREICKICCDERALLDIIDGLMEACEER